MKILLIISTLFFQHLLHAQDVERLFMEDMLTAANKLKELKACKMISVFELYRTHDSQNVDHQSTAMTYISGNAYYQNFDGLHSLVEGSDVAIIDEEEKTVVLDRLEKDVMPSIYGMNPEMSLNLASDIIVEESNSYRDYILEYKIGEYDKILIRYSKVQKRIMTVDMYYHASQGLEDQIQNEESPRLLIKIVSVDELNEVPYSFISNPFFSMSGKDNCVLKKAYNSYALINQLN